MTEKVLKITLACILVVIIIFLTLVLIFALNNKNMEFGSWGFNSKTELIKTENYNYGDIDIIEIKVNTRSADVKIIPTDQNEITINVFGQKDQEAKIEILSGTLNIEYISKHICFGFCNLDSYIEIKLPIIYMADVDVNTVSGDIYLEENAIKNINLRSVSGDISIENGSSLDVSTTSGYIKIKKANDLKVKSISGDIEVDILNGVLDAQTTSGEVDIKNMSIKENSNIKTISGDVEINAINDIYVDTSTVSGDVKIKNNNRLAEIVLNIITTSGDIEIN